MNMCLTAEELADEVVVSVAHVLAVANRKARQLGCEVLVTGETRFHTCLEAEAAGMGLLLPGHFASERFGVERLADVLARQFSQVQVWASRREEDPLRWI